MNAQPAPNGVNINATADAVVAATAVAALLARHPRRRDALLPALHALQDALGFIPPGGVTAIARHFNLSRAEVHGVITFYHDFRSAPPAPCVLRLCQAEACRSMGAASLLAHVEQALGCGLHGRSADGAVDLLPVYCLGQCANAPALMLGEAVHARVTPARFDALLARAVSVEEPDPTNPGGPSFLPEAV